jgi:hypothetical protein
VRHSGEQYTASARERMLTPRPQTGQVPGPPSAVPRMLALARSISSSFRCR